MEQDIFTQLGGALQKMCLKLAKNQALAKLLTVMDEDPLLHIDLDLNGQESIFERNIKTTPYVDEKEVKDGVVVLMPIYGTIDTNNDEFGIISVEISIFLPIDKWNINNTCQRPYLIMSQLYRELNRKRVTGIGELVLSDFQLFNLSDEISWHKMTFDVSAIA